MTTQEMHPACGETVLVTFEQIRVQCVIRDVKFSWGKPRLLVAPTTGSGQQWVELTRVVNPHAQPIFCTACNSKVSASHDLQHRLGGSR